LLNSRLTLDAGRFDAMARPRLSSAHIPGLVSAANGAAALVRTRIAMKGLLVGSVPDRRWPLHPPPSEREDLETWVRRISLLRYSYGVISAASGALLGDRAYVCLIRACEMDGLLRRNQRYQQ
jgi:hypothetical protein